VSRRAWLGAGVGVASGVAVAGVAVWYLALRDVAEPAKVADAVTSFREHGSGGRGFGVPAGVYVYATRGFETTDALTGVTHRYPSVSTITVTRDPCGFQMRWDVLKGRSTVWTYCTRGNGWTVASQDERHTFFGRTEHTDYRCTRSPARPAGDRPGTAFVVLCATAGADERGHGIVLGRQRVPVGGLPIETVHIRRASSFTGAIRGASKYDFWFARKRGIPVRVGMVSKTTNDSPVGDVHYEERVTLQLLSLAPRR
jgi:hypothetical protein